MLGRARTQTQGIQGGKATLFQKGLTRVYLRKAARNYEKKDIYFFDHNHHYSPRYPILQNFNFLVI